jgi:hypothetical protein
MLSRIFPSHIFPLTRVFFFHTRSLTPMFPYTHFLLSRPFLSLSLTRTHIPPSHTFPHTQLPLSIPHTSFLPPRFISHDVSHSSLTHLKRTLLSYIQSTNISLSLSTHLSCLCLPRSYPHSCITHTVLVHYQTITHPTSPTSVMTTNSWFQSANIHTKVK